MATTRATLLLKNVVFWDVALCRSCVNRRFGGTYRFHLQGRKIRERWTSVSRWLQYAAYKEILQHFVAIDFFLECKVSLWQYTGKIKFAETAYRVSSLWCLVLINIFSDTKYFPLSSKQSAFVFPTRNIGLSSFATFSFFFSRCPSARSVSAANAVCKCTNIFSITIDCKNPYLIHFLCFYCFFCYCFYPVLSYCCGYLYSCSLRNWPLSVQLSS
jgi:hypothetical protein